MTAAFYAAGTGRASSVSWQNPHLASFVASAPERQDLRVGGGFLSVIFIRSLAEVPSFIRESDQTIAYSAGSAARSKRWQPSRIGPGVSRWAPIGTASSSISSEWLRHPFRVDAAHSRLLKCRREL